MRTYIIRRILLLIPTLIGVSLVIFVIMRIVPGDPAMSILNVGGLEAQAVTQQQVDELRAQLGLNKPLIQQYLSWLWGLVTLDAGRSLRSDQPVFAEIGDRFPLTLELALMTVLVSIAIAIPIGVVSAMRQDTWVDYLFRVVSIAGLAMPSFWIGTLIILGLVVFFDWLPPLEYQHLWENPSDNLQQLVWPAVALGYLFSASVSRMTRSQTLEVLREDYIRTAWAKGLRERMIILRHALKNALLPVVTIVGLQVAGLLGGTVIMETLFNLPGMGSRLVEAVRFRDYPMVQTVITLFALIVVLTNLLVDVLYGWLDPRIRYS